VNGGVEGCGVGGGRENTKISGRGTTGSKKNFSKQKEKKRKHSQKRTVFLKRSEHCSRKNKGTV